VQYNYVLIVIDSVEYDTFFKAHLFDKIPNMSKIGKVEEAYSPCCWTIPYFVSIFTHPYLIQKNKYQVGNTPLFEWEPIGWVPEVFKKKGYHTVFITPLPWIAFLKHIFDKGWSEFIYIPEWDSSYSVIKNSLRRIHKEPFLHVLHFLETHWKEKGTYWSKVNNEYTELEWENIKVKALEDLDMKLEFYFKELPKNTKIIITSDHGNVNNNNEEGWNHNPRWLDHIEERLFKVPLIRGEIK